MADYLTPINVLGAIAVSLLSIWALIKVLWPFLVRSWNWVVELMFSAGHKQINATLDCVLDQLAAIAEEIKPHNGEGTIREAMNHSTAAMIRIEHRQEESYALLGAKLAVDEQAMFITDKNGKVTSNNYQHQILTGFSAAQVHQDNWINVITQKERQSVHDKWSEAVIEKRTFSENITYITHTNEEYLVHVHATPQIDSKGGLRGWLGVVTPLDKLGRRLCRYKHNIGDCL
jgi:PAS domain S-box-containing protein